MDGSRFPEKQYGYFDYAGEDRVGRSQKILTAVGFLVLTAVVSMLPGFHPERLVGLEYHAWLDRLFHGGYYFVAAYLLYPVFCTRGGALWFFLSLVLFSFGLEGAQSLIPERTFSLLDMAANVVGVGLATLIGRLKYSF